MPFLVVPSFRFVSSAVFCPALLWFAFPLVVVSFSCLFAAVAAAAAADDDDVLVGVVPSMTALRYWTNRSAAYFKLQKFEDAITDAGISRRLNPTWSKAYLREGQALMALERYGLIACVVVFLMIMPPPSKHLL